LLKLTNNKAMSKHGLLIAIGSGFLAVLLGAFGAHALKSMVPLSLLDTWKTASFYHFIHTVILIFITFKFDREGLGHKKYQQLFIGFLMGMILFSGSLYVYVISQITLFAMVTPIGGVVLLLSWAYWFKIERETPNQLNK